MLIVSLDNYSTIVTEKGKTAADLLVRALVEPIGSLLAPRDAIAILENRTIGILLETARLRGQAQDFAAEMIGLLKTAASDCGIKEPTACVGIAKITGSYVAPEDILRDAVIALRAAEAEGRDKIMVFHRGMDEQLDQAPIAI